MNDVKMAQLVAKIAFIGFPDTLSHTMRVVSSLEETEPSQTDGQRLVCAAWLHDVIEDSGIEVEMLDEHFDPQVIQALNLLTRRDDESYWDYIHRIQESQGTAGRIAKQVKLADAQDNLWRSRGQSKRQRRYQRVIATLEAERAVERT